jgi:CIC family chloride channel protein
VSDRSLSGCAAPRRLLVTAQGTGLPVLDETRTTLVGWITHQTILSALRPAADDG